MKNPFKTFSKIFLFAAASGAAVVSSVAVTPSEVYDDPLVGSQWQWDPTRGGINIAGAWQSGITGAGVVIGIVDQWVEALHEDLNVSAYNPSTNWETANLDLGLSYDFSRPGNSSEIYDDEFHGTFVAGMAAAVGGNGAGLVGAAPGATIAGLHTMGDSDAFYWASGVSSSGVYTGTARIDVKNNSYGSVYGNRDGSNTAISRTSANNVIYVFAAGNSRGNDSHQYNFPTNTGWSSFGNIREVITVAAMDGSDMYSSFSCYGSNVFVTAPGSGVWSTDRTGDIGYSDGNYSSGNGTSFSTPLVSGVMALGKQVFKDMDSRWAKHAIAWSSGHGEEANIDPTGTKKLSWETNATGFWQQNNGGYWFNNNYGFGKIDAVAFTDSVRDMLYTTVEKNVTVFADQFSAGATESSGVSRKAEFKFTPDFSQNIETVSVCVEFAPDAQQRLDLSNLKVTLVAPDDMKSVVVQGSIGDSVKNCDISYYTFLSNAFWGSDYENAGEWTLQIEYNANSETTDTTNWVTPVSVEFSTGGFAFETDDGSIADGEILEAHALALDNSGTNFTIEGTVKLEDSVNVKGGTLELAQTGTIAAYTQGIFGDTKGVKYVQTGGEAIFAGTAAFKRGFSQSGGIFTLAGGTLSAPGGISVSGTGKFIVSDAAGTLANTLSVSGSNALLAIASGGHLEYCQEQLLFSNGSSFVLEIGDADSSRTEGVLLSSSASVLFSDTSKIVLDFVDAISSDISNGSYVLIDGGDFTGVALTEASVFISGSDGEVYDGEVELEKTATRLVVNILGGDLISGENENKDIAELARFKSTLTRYEGTITGGADAVLRAKSNIDFEGNASGFSGTTEISSGTFSVKTSAQLGTGAFAVSENGVLEFDGDHSFDNTVSGGGKMKVVAGTLTFNGDASGLAGTEVVGNNAEIVAGAGSQLKNLTVSNNAAATLAGTVSGLTADNVSVTLLDTATLAGGVLLNRTTFTAGDGTGTLVLDAGQEMSVENNSTFKGNIALEDDSVRLTVKNSKVEGALSLNSGTLNLYNAEITGTLSADAGTLTISGSNKAGNIEISGGVAVSQASGATLVTTGTMIVTDNAAYRVSGDSSEVTLVVSNNSTLTESAAGKLGSVTLDNSTFIQDSGGRVAGSLTLQNNASATLAGTAKQVSVDATSTITATASAFVETDVTNDGSITLTAGTLTQKISGTGATIVTGDIVSSADNIGMTFTNNASIVLTGGTLDNEISGAGTVVVDGNVAAADAGCLQTPVAVNTEKTLSLAAGTLSQKISGEGTTKISGDVSTAADNLGTKTEIVSGTLALTSGTLEKAVVSETGTLVVAGNVSASKADLLKADVSVGAGNNLTLFAGTLSRRVTGAGTLKINGTLTTDADNLRTAFIENSRTLNLTGGDLTGTISGSGTVKITGDVSIASDNAFGNNKLVVASGSGGKLNIPLGVSVDSAVTVLLSDNSLLQERARALPSTIIDGDGEFSGTVTLSADPRYVNRVSETTLSFSLFSETLWLDDSVSVVVDESVWGEDWGVSSYSNGIVTLAWHYDPAAETYTAPASFGGLYSIVRGTTLLGYQAAAFDARLAELSPVSYGGLIEAQNGFANLVGDLLRERLEQRRYESAENTAIRLYANGFGQFRECDGDGIKSADYEISHAGVVAGIDAKLAGNGLFGFGVAADTASSKVKNGAKSTLDSAMLTFSGMKMSDNFYAGFGLSAGTSQIKAKRSVGEETFSTKTNGGNAALSLVAGAGFVLSETLGLDFSPFVGIDFGYTRINGFTEKGADSESAALKIDSFDSFSIRGKAGLSLNWRMTSRLRFGLEAAFSHEFLDNDVDIDAAFAQNADVRGRKFTSKARLTGEKLLQTGPRLDFQINKNWALSASYTYESDFDNVTGHTANLGARCRF